MAHTKRCLSGSPESNRIKLQSFASLFLGINWWRLMDLNHRTQREQIYSLPRLAASLSLHVVPRWGDSWWLGTESNRRHEDFQSSALPTELPSQNQNFRLSESPKSNRITLRRPSSLCGDKMAEPTGFEPAISCVTGRHVRPLHHGSALSRGKSWWRLRGSNPRPSACKADALPAELSLHGKFTLFGSGGGDRTPDLSGMNRTL